MSESTPITVLEPILSNLTTGKAPAENVRTSRSGSKAEAGSLKGEGGSRESRKAAPQWAGFDHVRCSLRGWATGARKRPFLSAFGRVITPGGAAWLRRVYWRRFNQVAIITARMLLVRETARRVGGT